MFELMETKSESAVIKVIGVGGGGSNAVHHMLSANIEGWISSVPIPTRRRSRPARCR